MSLTKESLEAEVGGCARSWSKTTSLLFVGVYYTFAIAAGGGVCYAVGTFTDITLSPDYPLFLAMIADLMVRFMYLLFVLLGKRDKVLGIWLSVFI